MFCHNCGKEIPDDSAFCFSCGTKQIYVPTKVVNETKANVENKKDVALSKPINKDNKQKKSTEKKVEKKGALWLAPVLLAVIVFCVAIGALIYNVLNPSVDINKYVNIRFLGYDTEGAAVCELDKEAFEKDYGKKLYSAAILKNKLEYQHDKPIKIYIEHIKDYFFDRDFYDKKWHAANSFYYDCVEGNFDNRVRLSNGDTVTYSWDIDDEYARREYGYKIMCKDITCKVTGLKEVEEFNPFEGVDVVFSGGSSDGYAEIKMNSQNAIVNYLDYELDKDSGLANGDTVVLSVSHRYGDVEHYCISNYGKRPNQLTKEFKVQGLSTDTSKNGDITGISETRLDAPDIGLMPPVEEEPADDGFVFPDSSEVIINLSDIEELSDEDLRLAINELYAKHGYIFKDEMLLAYYKQFDWYNPTVRPDRFSGNEFNSTEKANLKTMQKIREIRRR